MNAVLDRLPVLIVNAFSRCNCRCTMCDIWKITESQAITREDLELQMSSLESFGVEWVVLSGGEPLMHSAIFDLCAVLRERGIRITILSTGLLLERHADRLVQFVDEVIVSLDGPREVHDAIRRVPGSFDAIASGIQALRRYRPGFSVNGRCTIQRANHSRVVDAVADARQLGLDTISFLAADVQSSAFNRFVPWNAERQSTIALNPKEIQVLEAQMESLISGGECRAFVAESPEKLRRIVSHFQCHVDNVQPVAPQCNAPWVSAVVESDGTVRPCFFQPPFGKLEPGQTLAKILNQPAAVAFRQNLDVATNPICRQCVCSLHRVA